MLRHEIICTGNTAQVFVCGQCSCRLALENLTIIELAMYVCLWTCVWLATPKWLMSPSPKSQVMFASAFSGLGDFFLVFLDSYFLRYGQFGEYMNMHAASGLCTYDVSNVGGVTAGPARLNSSNVGVSLRVRARWDTGKVGHISNLWIRRIGVVSRSMNSDLIALVDEDEEEVEPWHDRSGHRYVLLERLRAVVASSDRVRSREYRRTRIQRRLATEKYVFTVVMSDANQIIKCQ